MCKGQMVNKENYCHTIINGAVTITCIAHNPLPSRIARPGTTSGRDATRGPS